MQLIIIVINSWIVALQGVVVSFADYDDGDGGDRSNSSRRNIEGGQ